MNDGKSMKSGNGVVGSVTSKLESSALVSAWENAHCINCD